MEDQPTPAGPRAAEAPCPNCATLRQGSYCYQCGQNNRDYRKSLPPMVWELMSEAFELDGRIVRSARRLMFSPGSLSAEFSANRRASYISPIRLYLFTSIAFFFALSMTSDVDEIQFDPGNVEIVSQADGTADAPGAVPVDQTQFRSYIEPDLQDELNEILAHNSLGAEILRGTMDAVNEDAQAGKSPGVVGRFIYNKMVKALSNPGDLVDELFDNVPIALFFLLPVYAGILKLMYVRSHKYYVEHLVFALHLHAFAFVLFTVLLFVPDAQDGLWSFVEDGLQIGFLVYYFMALRQFYNQSRRKTAVKFVLLLTVYSICLAPAALLVLLVTVSIA